MLLLYSLSLHMCYEGEVQKEKFEYKIKKMLHCALNIAVRQVVVTLFRKYDISSHDLFFSSSAVQ